ncbi:patatin-like phospholipase domain-containing protein [Diaphorobacter caeni]|uniref:phospholipase n=1 Tax=Diaphorobacter caeni TaxID=2784387 RepID=UPI00189039D8|nr:phospholipase [Diaphorobacter caeni]MBF5004548.1 phospholipase [Diaphorobacter caeni]
MTRPAKKALRIYAGPAALAQIRERGALAPDMVRVIPAAAGGPKGLILGPLDRFIFGDWLPGSAQPVHLIGGSIGAWRMATACLPDAVRAFERLEHDYIHQEYDIEPGAKRPSAEHVSTRFAQNLQTFFGGEVTALLAHPRYRLHVVTSHGRGLLAREGRLATPLGYLGAYASNAISRRGLAHWLERVVFSSLDGGKPARMPFDTEDFRTLQVALVERNFMPALQASCSIPFMLRAVHDIPGAPRGAYWDGGITDYHLHLRYLSGERDGIVLYPHFQKQVIPGWLDKAWRSRHHATSALDRMVVLAPDPEWVKTLPHAKLPDRNDFVNYLSDNAGRVRAWEQGVAAARQLADEFAEWCARPDPARLEPL